MDFFWGKPAPKIPESKCGSVMEALDKARTHAAAAKALLFEASRLGQVDIRDIRRLLSILIDSIPSTSDLASDDPHLFELCNQLPGLVQMLGRFPGDAKLNSLSNEDAVRVASVAVAAASKVRERSEKHQATLLADLDKVTLGQFKATDVVAAEGRKAKDIFTLVLSHITFNNDAANKLRTIFNNHLRLAYLDLSHCFLGDRDVTSLLRMLERLPHLAVVSLRGNALTDHIVPTLVNEELFQVQQQRMEVGRRRDQRAQSNNGNTINDVDDDDHAASTPAVSTTTNLRHPGLLQSQDKFMALRVLALEENSISHVHQHVITTVLAQRWARFEEQSGVMTSSSSVGCNNHNNNNNNIQQNAMSAAQQLTTLAFFRGHGENNHTPTHSTVLSLDGKGMAGVLIAKFLTNRPDIVGVTPPECIVATSASAIIACALGLGTISMAAVTHAFICLEQQVFKRSESDAKYYAESAGQWIRSWWTGGDYHCSTTTHQILTNLFGATKFSAITKSRVMVLVETASAGTVIFSSTSPSNPALASRAECFSAPSNRYSSQQQQQQQQQHDSGPTIAEVCLAAMAAPGYFAPRRLPTAPKRGVPSHSSSSSSSSSSSVSSAAPATIEVFDASGSVPNPALYALLECMQPCTLPRRLLSIAIAGEAQASSITQSGVAALSSLALSSWPAARGQPALREMQFARLLDAHDFVARATHNSVRAAVQSAMDVDRFAAATALEKQRQDISNKKKRSSNRQGKGAPTAVAAPAAAAAAAVSNTADDATGADDDAESIQKKVAELSVPVSVEANNDHDHDDDDDDDEIKHDEDKRKLDKRPCSLVYERLYPCAADAPAVMFNEPSERVLMAAMSEYHAGTGAAAAGSSANIGSAPAATLSGSSAAAAATSSVVGEGLHRSTSSEMFELSRHNERMKGDEAADNAE